MCIVSGWLILEAVSYVIYGSLPLVTMFLAWHINDKVNEIKTLIDESKDKKTTCRCGRTTI